MYVNTDTPSVYTTPRLFCWLHSAEQHVNLCHTGSHPFSYNPFSNCEWNFISFVGPDWTKKPHFLCPELYLRGSTQNISTHTHTHSEILSVFVLQWKIFTTTAAGCLAALWRQTEFPSHSCVCVCVHARQKVFKFMGVCPTQFVCVCVTECLLDLLWEGKHRSILYLVFLCKLAGARAYACVRACFEVPLTMEEPGRAAATGADRLVWKDSLVI